MGRSIPVHDPDYTGLLRERLHEQGITLGALARAMKMDRSQLSRLFNTTQQPNWRTIVRIEAALEAIAPVEHGVPSSSDVESSDGAGSRDELARLKGYVHTLGELIEGHDRTPARWRYSQTQWLWLYARGMVAGDSADAVRKARLEELENEKKTNTQSGRSRTVEYAKLEMFGGPADGRILYSETPISDRVVVSANTLRGRQIKVSYQKQAATIEETLPVMITGDEIADLCTLIDTFKAVKPIRYVFVSAPRRKRRRF